MVTLKSHFFFHERILKMKFVNITDTKKSNELTFSSVNIGDSFRVKPEEIYPYIKIAMVNLSCCDDCREFNAVNLQTGKLYFFDYNREVCCVNDCLLYDAKKLTQKCPW